MVMPGGASLVAGPLLHLGIPSVATIHPHGRDFLRHSLHDTFARRPAKDVTAKYLYMAAEIEVTDKRRKSADTVSTNSEESCVFSHSVDHHPVEVDRLCPSWIE